MKSALVGRLLSQAGFAAHRAWERQLGDARWAAVSWPTRYGGQGASLLEWLLFEEEYFAAGAAGAPGRYVLSATRRDPTIRL